MEFIEVNKQYIIFTDSDYEDYYNEIIMDNHECTDVKSYFSDNILHFVEDKINCEDDDLDLTPIINGFSNYDKKRRNTTSGG